MRRLLVASVLATSPLAACGEPEVVVPEVLTVLNVFPSHGAVDIGTSVEPYVFFSHALADTAVAAQAISLTCLGAGACASPDAASCGTAPAVTVTFNADAQSARLTSATALRAATCWVIAVQPGLEAANADVGPLPVEMRSSFQTR